MTPEIEILRANADHLAPLFETIEFEFDASAWKEISGVGYLTESDRQNPDIMSNVEAMEKTNAMISWFGRDQEGAVGLWRGPSQTPLEMAPVVRLDPEGQYELRGTSIANYLANAEPESFDTSRQLLTSLGLSVLESSKAVWNSIRGMTSPNDVRDVFYNEGRVKRGLAPIGLDD
jgi:hypothetical protein